jgi:hypothetical protein
MAKVNDVAAQFEERIRDIVRPMVDDMVSSITGRILGTGSAPRRGRPAGGAIKVAKSTGSVCGVVGCGLPVRSKGYCAKHYQSARKYGWPSDPRPASFSPAPVRRGRPPASASKTTTKAIKVKRAARKAKPKRGRKATAARKATTKTAATPATAPAT